MEIPMKYLMISFNNWWNGLSDYRKINIYKNECMKNIDKLVKKEVKKVNRCIFCTKPISNGTVCKECEDKKEVSETTVTLNTINILEHEIRRKYERILRNKLKEVNKGKKEIDFNKIPYFETKVIKVKKEKRCEHKATLHDYDFPRTGNSYKCDICGEIFTPKYLHKQNKEKANIVNGENLEEMRFPCYCEFDANKGSDGEIGKTYKVHGIGRLDKTFSEDQLQYQLSWADHQFNREGDGSLSNLSVICETPSLKRLMEIYDIQIRKAKLLIFKEEK